MGPRGGRGRRRVVRLVRSGPGAIIPAISGPSVDIANSPFSRLECLLAGAPRHQFRKNINLFRRFE